MKRHNIFFHIFAVYFFLLTCCQVTQPGFAAGTLVKIPGGYAPIESLKEGDWIYSITPNRTYRLSQITHTTSYTLAHAIKIITANDIIIAAPQQKFYLPHEKKWLSAKKISYKHHLGTGKNSCTQEFQLFTQNIVTDFFDIRLNDLHTFCVSTDDIIVHNFPLCFIGFSIAWGTGGISLDGIYLGICIAGWWLGTKLLRNNNSSHSGNKFTNHFYISPPNAPDPDDEEWKRQHPHGRYVESPKHHKNSRGRIGRPPRDGQAALDNSFEVPKKQYRIAVQDDDIVQLMKTRTREYHGLIIEKWNDLHQQAKNTLINNGYRFNPKTGKLKR